MFRLKLFVALLIALFVSGSACILCIGQTQPGPTNVVFVAAHQIWQGTIFAPKDVVAVKRDRPMGNDFHRLQDFIGKRCMGLRAGQSIGNLSLLSPKDSPIAVAGTALSNVSPIMAATSTIEKGQVVSRDNIRQIQIKTSLLPNNAVTYFDETDTLFSTKQIPKGGFVTYSDLTDSSSMSNLRRLYATRDLKAGELLNWQDLQARIDDKAEYKQNVKNVLFGSSDRQQEACKYLFAYPQWKNHPLQKNLKKGEMLDDTCLARAAVPYQLTESQRRLPPMLQHRLQYGLRKKIAYCIEDIPKGQVIQARALEEKEIEADYTPSDLATVGQVVGHIAKYGISKGQIVSVHDLQ
jgi:flagella basal body P-ring formation protein FlgA